MDQATTRPHHSFLAAIGDTHCAPTQSQFGRQLDGAAHPGRLLGCGPVQLRRPKDPAGFRRELHRIRRDGSTFLVELDDSPVPVDPITTRLADTRSACRHGTDGTADEPTARYCGGPGG